MADTLMLSPMNSIKSQSGSPITSRSNASSPSQTGMSVNGRGSVLQSSQSKPARVDAQKSPQPAHKKLSTLEAQRVMAVLTSAIRRAELATTFGRLAEKTNGEQDVAFGAELTRLIARNGMLNKSYNELCGLPPVIEEKLENARVGNTRSAGQHNSRTALQQREGFSQESSTVPESGLKSSQSSKDSLNQKLALEGAMSDSCRNALRLFLRNPAAGEAAIDSLQTSGPLRSQAAEQLIQQLKALREFLMSRLLTTPVEDVEKSRYIRDVREKEKYNAKIVAKLMSELHVVEQQRDDDISKLNEVIRKLQADLHQIELKAEETFRITRTEAERQQSADQKNSDGKLGKLQQDLALIRTQYNNLLSQHRDSEHALRKKKFQIETEVENWIQKYDGDMGERQDEYEMIDEVYSKERRQLNELEERFQALEVEYRRIMDERRVARETREAAERELQMCVRAALTIQSFWRSFKVRKAIKTKKKRGGGAGRVAATGGGQKKIKK